MQRHIRVFKQYLLDTDNGRLSYPDTHDSWLRTYAYDDWHALGHCAYIPTYHRIQIMERNFGSCVNRNRGHNWTKTRCWTYHYEYHTIDSIGILRLTITIDSAISFFNLTHTRNVKEQFILIGRLAVINVIRKLLLILVFTLTLTNTYKLFLPIKMINPPPTTVQRPWTLTGQRTARQA